MPGIDIGLCCCKVGFFNKTNSLFTINLNVAITGFGAIWFQAEGRDLAAFCGLCCPCHRLLKTCIIDNQMIGWQEKNDRVAAEAFRDIAGCCCRCCCRVASHWLQQQMVGHGLAIKRFVFGNGLEGGILCGNGDDIGNIVQRGCACIGVEQQAFAVFHVQKGLRVRLAGCRPQTGANAAAHNYGYNHRVPSSGFVRPW